MEYNATITLSSACVEAIRDGDVNMLDILYEELDGHIAIEKMLAQYHSGASISFKIDEGSLDIDTDGFGEFSVEYIKHVYSGCKDVDMDEEHEMLIEIVLNMLSAQATLSGEDILEREPDTY
ncbi:hypothetical protein [Mucilaginibacter dorajii]|uniref:Uncharacterized protein n=1 Tax=Mucilaginibacter dorajii TaxID=692994 RepID=A0ABP7PPH8_9SPHI|nr:hypothetical protein [Mucilaginibacter dorajii]MCS3736928.1 hypothetical protein [Mucilaginibacter dorajii]